MENINILYCVLLVVGAVYLGGISYTRSPSEENVIPILEDWAPPGEGEPSLDRDAEIKRQMRLNNKLEETEPIPEEAMLAFQKHFPYDLTSQTKGGQPILFIPLARWNITEKDNLDELTFHKYLDEMVWGAFSRRIPPSGAATGKNPKFYLLVNMEGTYEEEASKDKYLNIGVKLMVMLIQNYRHDLGKLIFINSSPNFIQAYSIVSEGQPKERRDLFEVLGEGKESWAPFLLHLISQHELPKELQRKLEVGL